MRKALSDSLWSGRVLHVGALGIVLFLMGGYWDVAWHIDLGRDTFWSPPHLLIYAGVLLLLGSLALGFGEAWRRRASGRPPQAGPALRLPGGVWMSPGLVMAGLGALMSLTSAPVDELWHWVYGQDVTIWSPPHLQLIFGVVIPYAAAATFGAGLVRRVIRWAKAPVPFRIPTTCGQQKSLPWIRGSTFENPSTAAGAAVRVALEVLFFRSLVRNTRFELRQGPRLVYLWEKWLWLAGLLFHWSLFTILIRHLRFLRQAPGARRGKQLTSIFRGRRGSLSGYWS